MYEKTAHKMLVKLTLWGKDVCKSEWRSKMDNFLDTFQSNLLSITLRAISWPFEIFLSEKEVSVSGKFEETKKLPEILS